MIGMPLSWNGLEIYPLCIIVITRTVGMDSNEKAKWCLGNGRDH